MCSVRYLHGERKASIKGLFNLEEKGITHAHAWKLKPDEFKLEIKQTFSKVSVNKD